MDNYLTAILLGIIAGSITRFLMLKVDYRQYPSYPQAYAIHMVLGMVASALGAMIIPAFLSKEYTAATFFALAAQQFREIRNVERQSLQKLEEDELVKRGNTYIEDMAKKLESRNFYAMLISIATCAGMIIFKEIYMAAIIAVIVYFLLYKLAKEMYIKDIAEVESAVIEFDGPLLMVEGVVLCNLAQKRSRDMLLNEACACMIVPKDINARVTLSMPGQQKAILHDICAQLGTFKDVMEADYTPMAKMDPISGNLMVIALTIEGREHSLIKAAENCPVLESSRKKPNKKKYRKGAKDD